MAIDLEAIKRRVAELSGVKRTSSVQLWKPTIGEHKIRCLPWKNAPDGQPFTERWFYYIGENAGILSPKPFGKPDPIDELVKKLYSSGKPDDRNLAKKLQAKMRCYTPVIVRGQEDKGVMVWAFGKIVYQRMLSFFLDDEVGDILSPTEGFDLKVTLSQSPGKQFMDTMVDPARRPSKLHEDPALLQKWTDSIPNIDDMYRPKTYQEIEGILSNWLNGGTGGPSVEEYQGGGAVRGESPKDNLDELASELKPATTAAVATPVTDKKPKAKEEKKSSTLDAAFEDLMNED